METVVHGKWILAGEHAVLRGSPALVFPLPSKHLKLSYTPFSSLSTLSSRLSRTSLETSVSSEVAGNFDCDFSGDHGEELRLLFWGVIERALGENVGGERLTGERLTGEHLTGERLAAEPLQNVFGRFQLFNNIPVGAGLGASAALCVAVARWCQAKGYVAEPDLYEFSRQLENLFHGESSGVDIAVALTGRPIRFERGGVSEPLSLRWKPQWYLSYSGQRGVTSHCVNKVKEFAERHPETAKELDHQMATAARESQFALTELTEDKGFSKLVHALELAGGCFEKWGLAAGKPGQHLRWLREAGARAVKPTGSGDGGFALSLWDRSPPQDVLARLIPISLSS